MKALVIGALMLSVSLSALATTTYGPIKRGDTLWRIAVKERPSRSVSVHDMLLAIQKMNATTLNGTSNLSVGDTLTIPSTVAEVKTALQAPSAQKPATTQAFIKTNTAPIENKPVVIERQVVPVSHDSRLSGGDENVISNQVKQSSSSGVQTTSTASNNSSFPWGWLWFVVVLVASAYIAWLKIAKKSFPLGEVGMAAQRLGISNRRTAPHITKYKTRRFQDMDPQKPTFQGVNNTPFSKDSADAIAGAMIDMAENENSNAERILKTALSKDTKNLELRMKLLELYVQTDNRAAFKQQADEVEAMVPEHSAMWNTVRAMYLNKWAYDG